MIRDAISATLLVCAGAAHGAGPYVTDDAAIAPPGACQLEAWGRWFRDGHDLVALPACNTIDRVEATLGYVGQHRSGVTSRNLVLQGKTVFREFTMDHIGFGAAAGAAWGDDPTGERGFSQGYLYVPVTVPVEPIATHVHANAGVLHDEILHRQFGTWALGAETAVAQRWALNLEFYGDLDHEPSTQGGVTVDAIPRRLTLFIVAGMQHHDEANGWGTLGFAFSGSLFPP